MAAAKAIYASSSWNKTLEQNSLIKYIASLWYF